MYANPNVDALDCDEVITQGAGNDYCMSHLTLVPTPEQVIYPLQQATSHAEDQAPVDTESAEAPKVSLQAIEVRDQNEM